MKTSRVAPGPVSLAALADAWELTPLGPEPEWTRVRGVLAYLGQHPDELADALAMSPAASGCAVQDALLAGLAELLADRAGLPRPPWTSAVPGLTQEWLPAATPSMAARWRAATPQQLRDRHLVVDEQSLFRQQSVAPPDAERHC